MAFLFFVDRSSGHPSKHLDWKVYMFMAGSALVLAGIYFGNRWVMWGALVVLAAAFALRFIPGGDAPPEEGDGVTSDDHREGD